MGRGLSSITPLIRFKRGRREANVYEISTPSLNTSAKPPNPPSMPAQEVQAWQCPITKKVFLDKAKADKCTAAAKTKKTKQEKEEKLKKEIHDLYFLRCKALLNADSLNEVFNLIITKSKEFWDIDITHFTASDLRYDKNRNIILFNMNMSAGKLTSKTTSFLRKYAEITYGKGSYFSSGPNISSLFLGVSISSSGIGFLGISSGSGVGGRFGDYSLKTGGSAIYVDMFPNLKKTIDRNLKYQHDISCFDGMVKEIESEAGIFSRKTIQYQQAQAELLAIEKMLEDKKKDLNVIEIQGKEVYKTVALKGIEDLKPQIDQSDAEKIAELSSDFIYHIKSNL